VINREITTVSKDTLLMDMFELVSAAAIPVAVVDENQRMKGIVIKGALIGALAGNEEYIHTHDHSNASLREVN
jgi:glycine betaine/proline transport system ATP-binding protein